MALIFVLLAIVVAAAAADDSCPTASEISPCTCDGEGINCMGSVSEAQIKKAFKADFKYGGVRAVWIQGTPLTRVTSDLINKIKTLSVYIEVNNVTSLDLNAFSGSVNSLSSLSLFGNKLTNFDYDGIVKYQKLASLNLGRNLLTSIPANAFKNDFLQAVILAQNQITTIGANAFKRLARLQRLELSLNPLKTLGSYAITSPSPMLQVGLQNCQISDVSNTAFDSASPHVLLLGGNKLTSLKFDAFGTLATRMGSHGGIIEVSGNPFSCKGCDYSWVARNRLVLARMLLGFRCTDGKGLQQLTLFNIDC